MTLQVTLSGGKITFGTVSLREDMCRSYLELSFKFQLQRLWLPYKIKKQHVPIWLSLKVFF